MSDEMAAIGVPPVQIDVAGEILEIRPIKVKQLPDMLDACMPIMHLLAEEDLMGAVALNSRSLISAIRIGAGVSQQFMDDLDIDDLVRLGAVVLQVNGDFFARRVRPELEQALLRVNEALMPDGPPSSTDSSEPATAA